MINPTPEEALDLLYECRRLRLSELRLQEELDGPLGPVVRASTATELAEVAQRRQEAEIASFGASFTSEQFEPADPTFFN